MYAKYGIFHLVLVSVDLARKNEMTVDRDRYQCLVVGLGAMGSATLYHLARRGIRALGIEQFRLGHNRGSSHGETRVFRTTYEKPVYSQLALEALELWRSLEQHAGESLLQMTGALAFAKRGSERFDNNVKALRQANLPHEVMDGPEASRRFDAFCLGEEMVAFYAERNGFLRADRALAAMRQLAKSNGADVLEQTPVQSIEVADGHVTLQAGDRSYVADQAVITAGSWLGHVLADLSLPLTVTREQKVYFDVGAPERFQAGRLPVFVHYDSSIYGLPARGTKGLKIAVDHGGISVDPNSVNRTVDEDYIELLLNWLRTWMPSSSQSLRAADSAVCLYTCTPDRDFIIDRHPKLQNVLVAGGFSGHGFKFSILVGDILADLAIDGSTQRPIGDFRIDRFN